MKSVGMSALRQKASLKIKSTGFKVAHSYRRQMRQPALDRQMPGQRGTAFNE